MILKVREDGSILLPVEILDELEAGMGDWLEIQVDLIHDKPCLIITKAEDVDEDIEEDY